MFHRWKLHRQENLFQKKTAAVWDTPPMPVVDAPWNNVSGFYRCDAHTVQMYLIAIKSFYARIKRGKITLFVERGFSPDVRRLLEHHLPGIRFAIFEDIDMGTCQ